MLSVSFSHKVAGYKVSIKMAAFRLITAVMLLVPLGENLKPTHVLFLMKLQSIASSLCYLAGVNVLTSMKSFCCTSGHRQNTSVFWEVSVVAK